VIEIKSNGRTIISGGRDRNKYFIRNAFLTEMVDQQARAEARIPGAARSMAIRAGDSGNRGN
jgi:hypothetical protein